MDIFQTQTSAQLILARAASLVRKGSKQQRCCLLLLHGGVEQHQHLWGEENHVLSLGNNKLSLLVFIV